MKVIDFSKTIIYKIVCNDLTITDVYVGHTTNFTQRKNSHKSRCINEQNKCYHFQVYGFIRANGGWDNWQMIEIEKYPCNDSNEATARERFWFENLDAKLNSRFPNRDVKERTEINKEKIKTYQKIYCSTKYTCECGAITNLNNKSKHIKTKKHLTAFEMYVKH